MGNKTIIPFNSSFALAATDNDDVVVYFTDETGNIVRHYVICNTSTFQSRLVKEINRVELERRGIDTSLYKIADNNIIFGTAYVESVLEYIASINTKYLGLASE